MFDFCITYLTSSFKHREENNDIINTVEIKLIVYCRGSGLS